MGDADILALLRARKQEGLNYLLDKYAGLMNYIVKNTGIQNNEDVSECISDILFTIWKRINKYDQSKASFKTWIIIVTRGCAIDNLRKNAKHSNVVPLDEINEISISDNDLLKGPENNVLSLLQELTPPDNHIFYRRFVLGESVTEIAKVLGITQENVYKRISRGKEKLKVLVEKEGYQYA